MGRAVGPNVKHALYEDAITHRFAVIGLPSGFIEGDKLPIPATARWFGTRAEALVTLFDLFDQEGVRGDDSLQ